MAIANGLYPEKCLACYEAGITFCKYWNKNFECEQYEKGYGEKIVKKFKWMDRHRPILQQRWRRILEMECPFNKKLKCYVMHCKNCPCFHHKKTLEEYTWTDNTTLNAGTAKYNYQKTRRYATTAENAKGVKHEPKTSIKKTSRNEGIQNTT